MQYIYASIITIFIAFILDVSPIKT